MILFRRKDGFDQRPKTFCSTTTHLFSNKLLNLYTEQSCPQQLLLILQKWVWEYVSSELWVWGEKSKMAESKMVKFEMAVISDVSRNENGFVSNSRNQLDYNSVQNLCPILMSIYTCPIYLNDNPSTPPRIGADL